MNLGLGTGALIGAIAVAVPTIAGAVTSVVVLLGFSLGTWFGAARAEREYQQHLTQIKK